MPDQLDELKRQRALVAEHLAWLDRQIAAAAMAGGEPSSNTGNLQAGAPTPEVAPATKLLTDRPETDALFAQFAAEESPALRPPSKSGCWIVFSVMLILLIGGAIAVIYSAYR